MDNSGARRVIPIILVLIVIAVVIAVLVSVGQNIFGGGGGTTEEVNQGKRSLLNTSEDRSVRMIVRGRIVADENYYSYTITVKPTGRTMTTNNGYLNRVVATEDLTNNIPAYEQFVGALDRAGMMNAPELTGEANNTVGICPAGRMATFETLRGTTVVKSLWRTSCPNATGSLKTEYIGLVNLFNAQIPDSATMISQINFQ
jgi:hypothetical protein